MLQPSAGEGGRRAPEIAATALRYPNPKLRVYTARMAAMLGFTWEPLLFSISGKPPLVPLKCSVMLSPARKTEITEDVQLQN